MYVGKIKDITYSLFKMYLVYPRSSTQRLFTKKAQNPDIVWYRETYTHIYTDYCKLPTQLVSIKDKYAPPPPTLTHKTLPSLSNKFTNITEHLYTMTYFCSQGI